MNEMDIDVIYIDPDGYLETDYIGRFKYQDLKGINIIIEHETDLYDLRQFVVCCKTPKFFTLQSLRKENSFITLTLFDVQEEFAEMIEGYVHDNVDIAFIDMFILQVNSNILTWTEALQLYDKATNGQI